MTPADSIAVALEKAAQRMLVRLLQALDKIELVSHKRYGACEKDETFLWVCSGIGFLGKSAAFYLTVIVRSLVQWLKVVSAGYVRVHPSRLPDWSYLEDAIDAVRMLKGKP